MLIRTKDHALSFSLFNQFPELICRISTRGLGDLNIITIPRSNAQVFLNPVSIEAETIILMQQTHGAQVVLQSNPVSGAMISAVDGVISNAKRSYFGVRTADCVPLFFYDPELHIVGMAHAGWRGTLLNITEKIVKRMEEIGSAPESIYVGIGPHIGSCCYSVPQSRGQDFIQAFGITQGVVREQERMYFLDIGQANRIQLIESGILPEHIDWSIMCTSCQHDLFFSYRKDTKDTFGEMLGIIGMRD